MRVTSFDIKLTLSFFTGLSLALFVYWPGLSGGFIFDDYPNLSALGSNGGVNSLESFRKYILSGFAGPTGRPVSLLSFLVNNNNWPAHPFSFKYTNLLIHILNSVLLFWVLFKLTALLEGRAQPSRQAKAAALVAALAWLLHPYLVSTTLYVVQRMAQLPLSFSLIGILFWLHGRRKVDTDPIRAYLWMTIGISVGGMLALLSKENGVLLPLLVWVVEVTLVRSTGAPSLSIWWRRLFFIMPALCILGYLIHIGFSVGWDSYYGARNFSPTDRLLTQTRVLFSYLYHWFVPHLFTTGVFHDSFEISRSILTPISTLWAVLATITLVSLGIYYRRKFPILSCAILFFYVSQLIESTTVGLEIMFEHRVYLGSIFLFFPSIYFIWKKFTFRAAGVFSVCLLALLAIFCWRGATLWGDYPKMIDVWAAKAPMSPRAQVESARIYYDAGLKNESLAILNEAAERLPDSFYVNMTRALVACRIEGVRANSRKNLVALAKISHYSPNWFNMMQKSLSWVNKGDCDGMKAPALIEIVDAFLSNSLNDNPNTVGFSQLHYVKGIAALMSGKGELALKSIRVSVGSRRDTQKLMNVAAFLATYGYHADAAFYANKARERLISGELRGKELAEAPKLSDIDSFIEAVEKDRKSNG